MQRCMSVTVSFDCSIPGCLRGELLTDCFAEVDILSTSCIHQGVPHVDFSLKIVKPQSQDELTEV